MSEAPTNSTSKPANRLGRYSIGFLLILTTAVACFLGYLIKWKTDRTNALVWMQSNATFWEDLPVDQMTYHDTPAPAFLDMLGARGLKSVCVVVPKRDQIEEKQAELDGLFPEAEILVVCPGSGYHGKNVSLLDR